MLSPKARILFSNSMSRVMGELRLMGIRVQQSGSCPSSIRISGGLIRHSSFGIQPVKAFFLSCKGNHGLKLILMKASSEAPKPQLLPITQSSHISVSNSPNSGHGYCVCPFQRSGLEGIELHSYRLPNWNRRLTGGFDLQDTKTG